MSTINLDFPAVHPIYFEYISIQNCLCTYATTFFLGLKKDVKQSEI
jgi:hypothetical protein